MVNIFPLLFAAVVGFTHAFEVDHLLAVSSIVTRRKSMFTAVKDGLYWGLGHTSTILVVGMMMIVARVAVAESTFHFFEAGVGFMLILLGAHRIWKTWNHERRHAQAHAHAHEAEIPHNHRLAYGVGLIHGLAGSGTIVLLAMTQLKGSLEAVLYLLIFGIGSIGGMLLASGVFSLPFSKKLTHSNTVRWGFTLLSSVLCIGFGIRVIFENMSGL